MSPGYIHMVSFDLAVKTKIALLSMGPAPLNVRTKRHQCKHSFEKVRKCNNRIISELENTLETCKC